MGYGRYEARLLLRRLESIMCVPPFACQVLFAIFRRTTWNAARPLRGLTLTHHQTRRWTKVGYYAGCFEQSVLRPWISDFSIKKVRI